MSALLELPEVFPASAAPRSTVSDALGRGELRRLARSRLKEGGRNTVLDTTSLVHECYLRFVKVGELKIEDRKAFFAPPGLPRRKKRLRLRR